MKFKKVYQPWKSRAIGWCHFLLSFVFSKRNGYQKSTLPTPRLVKVRSRYGVKFT